MLHAFRIYPKKKKEQLSHAQTLWKRSNNPQSYALFLASSHWTGVSPAFLLQVEHDAKLSR